jgi:N-dimethylarginine dimethylaminohydrolase
MELISEIGTSTATAESPYDVATRRSTTRRYLMCPPTHFDVTYSINPWMDPGKPVDQPMAAAQWQRIHDQLVDLGHTVELVPPVPGLPDMVFAANGATVFGDRALVARFRYADRYYHLDTALAVLDEQTVMYYPAAFTSGSRAILRELFPAGIIASPEDAETFGLNAVSDGRHVLMPAGATRLDAQLREAGFEPIGIDVSELLRAGGGVKCCTLELHGQVRDR